MARTFSRPRATYQPGIYGPFSLDGLTNDDTSRVVVTLTIVDWPVDANPLFIAKVRWSDGSEATYNVSGNQGIATSGTLAFAVPMVNGVKIPIDGATITMEVFAAMTTAVSAQAV